MDEIAVLIPCFNEEITVGKVVRDFKRALPQATVYVYDNNSTDKTVEKAKEAGAIVRYEYQQGKGNVVRRMFQEIEAQCYILVDADDTYPASEAAKMTERVLKYHADMVVGDRLSSTYFKVNKRRFRESLYALGSTKIVWWEGKRCNDRVSCIELPFCKNNSSIESEL